MSGTTTVIGIDPDQTASGVAIWRGETLTDLLTLPLLPLIQFISEQKAAGALFVLEDVEANKPVFRRGKTSTRAMMRIAQNVGSVKARARDIEQALQASGAEFVKIKPLKGWYKQAKTDAAMFNSLTGWTGRSNADKRDAAMLALHYIRSKNQRGERNVCSR